MRTAPLLALGLLTASCGKASAPQAKAPPKVVLEPQRGPSAPLPNPLRVADSTHGGGFENCYRSFRPSGNAGQDLAQMTALCGPPNAMKPVTPVVEGRQSQNDPIARFTFTGETGRCYRVFSASDGGVTDLDMAVLDPDKQVIGHDTNADAFPILNPDGPLCLTRPGVYTVLVSVERGSGHYAMQVWGF